MAGIFPTRFEQINDFSARAGERVIDSLGKQQDPSNILQQIVDRAYRASESQKLTEAIDTYRRGMEAGEDASEVLKRIDPRMAGSAAFQDRSDAIRNSVLNQEKWDEAMRQQKITEDANTLLADYIKFSKELPGGEALWIQRNIGKLQANPMAYKNIMSVAPADISLPAVGLGEAPKINANLIRSQLQKKRSEEQAVLDRASQLGIASSDLEDAPQLKSLNSFIDTFTKKFGYEGDDAEDFDHNMRQSYNALMDVAKKYAIPEEAVLAAMVRNMDNPFWFFSQKDIDRDSAERWLNKYGETYVKERNRARTAKETIAKMDEFLNNETPDIVAQGLISNARRADAMFTRGNLSAQERAIYNALLAQKALSNLDAMTKPIVRGNITDTK